MLRTLTRDWERLVWNKRDTENQLRAHLLAASPGTTAGKTFAMLLFVDQFELLNSQVRAITGRIRELLAGRPDVGSPQDGTASGGAKTAPPRRRPDNSCLSARPINQTVTF